ncbi:helicase HerA domain-containing protein [Microcoleus sp. herbarium2]|uniref:helicase HerA domain-containing protein n=1 Tax=Microcoleus sp. herbarium2 TaxID=3055433 RepID=UPI002FD752F9
MSTLVYRIKHLPDLEKTEYHARYGDDPASRLSEMQGNFLYTLHNIANQYPLTCSLVYSYNPDELNQDLKLAIFVRVNFEDTLAQEDLEQIVKIFESSFWEHFYKVKKIVGSINLDLNWVQFISFGIKQEEKIEPTVAPRKNKDGTKNISPSYYYCLQPFEPNDDNNLVSFVSQIESYQKRVVVEIAIKPTMLIETEQKSLETLLRGLDSITSYESETSQISGERKYQPIDPIAKRTLDLFEDLREALLNRRLYEFSLRVLAEEEFTASLLLNEFWVESSEQPLYREIGIGKNDPRFAKAIQSVELGTIFPEAVWTDYWNSVADNSTWFKFRRLHRLFTVEEAQACFKVVIPNSVVVFSGIPKETDLKSEDCKNSILLGWQAGRSQNQALVPLSNFNKHVFICGVPGSGKTTAVLNLLFQLWTEHGIPFLVIEPAKTEYRAMLKCGYKEEKLKRDPNPTTNQYITARNVEESIDKLQSDLLIYSLGNERVCPFRFNPFAFYGRTTLDEHISTLEACFKGALPLFGPMPALLAEAIEQVYAKLGWQPQDTADYGMRQQREFPTMQELYLEITGILDAKQYSSDIKSDLKTALEVRIGGLLRRSVGNMLNTRTSVPDIATLMERPVILEMDSLNEEQANLMTMFILATLRQYARVTRKSGSPLKHITVIEEAHNIVGSNAQASGEEGASNPKAEATKYIVKMLAEMRALGEGMIIADQLPSAVSPEVIKNTNVKLAHRTVSGDDREILQQSMLLTGTQSEDLARSSPGEAYLFMEGTYKPVRIQEPNTKLIYGIEEPPTDEELVECVRNKEFYQVAIAAKNSLHKEKVSQCLKDVCSQLDILYQSCLPALNNGEQLLEMSPFIKPEIQKIDLFDKRLKEFTSLLKERIEATQTELKNIWITSRKQGVHDAVQSDALIQKALAKLTRVQQNLSFTETACVAVRQAISNLRQGLQEKDINNQFVCENYYKQVGDILVNFH